MGRAQGKRRGPAWEIGDDCGAGDREGYDGDGPGSHTQMVAEPSSHRGLTTRMWGAVVLA